MINSNDRRRPLWRRVLGTGVRLCCLLALCLALSPSSKAWYVLGFFPKTGSTTWSDTWTGDGENMGSSSEYTFGTDQCEGTVYFKLYSGSSLGSTYYGATTTTDTELTGSYTCKSDTSIGNVGCFCFTMKKGTTYKISFNGSVVTLTATEAQPGILGEGYSDSSWNSANYTFTEDSDYWWYKNLIATGTTIKFVIRYYNGSANRQYQPQVDYSSINVTNGTEYDTWDKDDSDTGRTATFDVSTTSGNSYSVWFNTSSKKVKVIWDGSSSTTTPTIVGTWPGHDNDFSGSGTEMTGKDGDSWYEYALTPTESGTVYFRTHIGDTKYYPKEGSSADVAVKTDDTKYETTTTSNGHSFKFDAVGNTTYYVKFYPNDSHKVAVYGATIEDDFVSKGLPVFPNGTYTESEIKGMSSDEWPICYLQGKVLNNNRITPEYQMTKREDGKYELTFTYRNSETEDDSWVKGYHYIWVEKFASADALSTVHGKRVDNLLSKNSKEGRLYTAVYDPDTDKLELTDGGQQMPFISMIGADWKQRDVYVTPSPYLEKSTSDGWQEAWIQYNDRGVVAKDRAGNVMYNTMWPPRNNINFISQFTVGNGKYDLTVSTDQLVLKPGESKSGSEWKKDAMFSKYGEGTLDYKSPVVSDTRVLALDDERSYTLYRVENLWIVGEVKLWTGWGGVAGVLDDEGKSVANWSWHSNWGHFEESEIAKSIEPEQTIPLSNRNGDLEFDDPTYFRYVDFFYDESNPAEKGYSVLFTELARCGAEIAAANKESDYTVGYYRPSLTAINGVSQKITGIKIACYNSNTKEFMGNVFGESYDGLDPSAFASQFPDTTDSGFGSEENTSSVSKAKYLEYSDSKGFANGNYYFVMTVTFDDGTSEEVMSNPFAIYNSEVRTTLTAYQLVSVKGGDNTYVTYVADGGIAYEVVDDDGQYTLTSLDSVPDYGDAEKYEFTEKVLLIGNNPNDVDEVLGYSCSEGAAIADGATYSKKEIQTGNGNRFAEIVEFTDLEKNAYALRMKYKMNVPAASADASSEFESSVGTTSLALTVPTPKLMESRIEVFYGSDNTEATDNYGKDFVYKGYDLENARYQNLREMIEVCLPNVSENLQSIIDRMSITNEDGTVSRLFTYKFGGQDVTDEIVDVDVDVDVDGVKWGRYTGSVSEPSVFLESSYGKEITLEKSDGVNYFSRWEDGAISGVDLTDDCPVSKSDISEKCKIEVQNASLYYDDKGDLINTFDVYVQLDGVNANYVVHGNGDKDDLRHGYTDDGAYDYFLVSVVEKKTDTKGNETEEVAIKETDAESYEYAEGVYTVNNLDKEHDGGGSTIHFERNYGQWYEGQLEAVRENPLYKSLEVRVSYLYPFNTDNVTESSSRSGMMRTAADLTGDVIKSPATVYSFADADGVVTSVEGVGDAAEASVKAGVGHVTVVGEDVVIYNAQGMLVATGEGRHELDAGVYVVRVGGGIHKVVVR